MRARGPLAVAATCVIAVVSPLRAPAIAQDAGALRRRVTELEEENRRLRDSLDLQLQELLETREKLKELAVSRQEGAGDTPWVKLGEQEWDFAAGVLGFSILDAGDGTSRNLGSYHVEGDQAGVEFSAGKAEDRFGLSLYRGDTTTETETVPPAEEPYAAGSGRFTSDRTDIDAVWSHMILRNDRAGVAALFGGKYLFSKKSLTWTEDAGERHDSRTFEGDNSWAMASAGVYVMVRVFESYPLSVFGSAAGLLGVVEGMVLDTQDPAVDGVVEWSYRTNTLPAWGLNGTVGLVHPVTRHGSFRAGFRAQGLDSVDGWKMYGRTGSFYDGHNSLFAAIDVLF